MLPRRDSQVLIDDEEFDEAIREQVVEDPASEARRYLAESKTWDATLGDRELAERLYNLFEYPVQKSLGALNEAAGPLKKKHVKTDDTDIFEKE